MILTATLLGNVGLDSHPDSGEVLHGVVLRIDATNYREASAIVQVVADAQKFGPKRREGEVLTANEVSIQLKGYRSCQLVQWRSVSRSSLPLKETRADLISVISAFVSWQTYSSLCLKRAPVHARSWSRVTGNPVGRPRDSSETL